MKRSIVLELQELASDSEVDIAGLLRKALVVATKLNLFDLENWIKHELEGYAQDAEIPNYRRTRAELRAKNPHYGLIPFLIQNEEVMNMLCDVSISRSVPELEDLVSSSEGNSGVYLHIPFSQVQLEYLYKRQQEWGGVAMEPVRIIGRNQVVAILQAVQTEVLKLSLELERAGILGDGLTFTKEEREQAAEFRTIHIENMQGIIGDVRGGAVSQENVMNIGRGDWKSLELFLRSRGVVDEDINELKELVLPDGAVTQPGQLGPGVADWMAKMVQKAANGIWDIGIAAAGQLLGSAIGAYYGIR